MRAHMHETAGAWFGSGHQFGMGLFPESKEGGKAPGGGRMVLGHQNSPSCTCELRDEAEMVTW